MCGIFCYVGSRPSAHLLVDGLKRLEYRGYDSWGISLACKGDLVVAHQLGRISEADLGKLPEATRSEYSTGIAHTRWATHGAPSIENAHPHTDCSGRITVVHNGIIENHGVLRAKLESNGHVFSSQTDTEVIAHLIEDLLADGDSPNSAFLGAIRLLEGTYGVAVLFADDPEVVYAARNASPMVLGVGQDEMFLASDPAPLVAHTRHIVYLEDGEAVALRAKGFETHDLNAIPISKHVEEIAFDLPDIERDGYPHFMLKEIFEQPETISNAFRGRIVRSEGTTKLGGVDDALLRNAKRCHIIACGTSWHAGLVGKYLLENLAHIPTQVSYAAEFRYANPVIEPDTLMIAISQSGETADTLAGISEAKLRGASTIGICNVVGSSIARMCGQGIYTHAGPEIGVASTKAFTSQVTVLLLLAVHMGRMRGMSLRSGLEYLQAIEELPEKARAILMQNEQIREIAFEYINASNFLYVGRLYEYPIALEGALKLKEISYVHAEGIQAAELKHGPIALVEPSMPTVVLAAEARVLGKMKSNIQEILARGGKIIAVAREGDNEINELAEHTMFIPSVLDPIVPILSVIPLQLLAYHIAVGRGCDVDRPRNLAKSVTVE